MRFLPFRGMASRPAPTADELHTRLDGRRLSELDDLTRSLAMAELSMIAYLDGHDADEPAEVMGFADIEFIDRDGAQATVFLSEHDRVVACRGTEPQEWNDIRADANALTDLAETVGRVHRGFKREVDDLWPLVKDHLVEDGRDVWFTGHSLGGAMAMICAGRCELDDIPIHPVQVVTFGAPRVGTKRYVTHADLDILRWVNNNDVVARVPPMWMGYQHAGKLRYLDADGVLRKLSRKAIAEDRWRGFVEGLKRGRVDNLQDHLILDYVAHIAANLERQDLTSPQRERDQSAK